MRDILRCLSLKIMLIFHHSSIFYHPAAYRLHFNVWKLREFQVFFSSLSNARTSLCFFRVCLVVVRLLFTKLNWNEIEFFSFFVQQLLNETSVSILWIFSRQLIIISYYWEILLSKYFSSCHRIHLIPCTFFFDHKNIETTSQKIDIHE